MEQPQGHRTVWLIVAAGVVVTALILSGSSPDPNTELARTARDAVAMAHEAQSDNRAAVLWAERFRLLAIVVGVSVPIVVMCSIWRSSSTGELSAAEIIEGVEEYALPGLAPSVDPMLPTASSQRGLCDKHEQPAD